MGAAEVALLRDGPADAADRVLLAHGAGQGMDSPFMAGFAAGLAANGMHVARFEFPYMRRRRAEGVKAPPDRQPVLLDAWRAALDAFGDGPRCVIGGKSLGGRMAAAIADAAGARALLCLGFPFHPPGKPDRLRLADLAGIATPTLILQGTRDPFGTPEEVAGYALSPAVRIHWIADGDHSWHPRKASGRSDADTLAEGVAAAAAFITAC